MRISKFHFQSEIVGYYKSLWPLYIVGVQLIVAYHRLQIHLVR